ncbi:DUF3152 domain-containing protein [Kribbella deserti]|uniref:DUF3152 domain-containing protein n=1 Tax=Kribbella deserti TaxID=1926257 RepID=A0ABV6QJR2_9ACTN
MRKARIIGLGVAAAVVAAAVYQLPGALSQRDDSRIAIASAPSTPPGVEAGTPKPAETRSKSGSTVRRPAQPRITYPDRGSASYDVLPGDSRTIGTDGPLLRYRVVVERGIQGVDRAALARFIRATYADPRGWTGGGKRRLRQVGPNESFDYVLMLVTPATRDNICGGGYDRYTSCRIKDRVVLNVARWVHGVPNYGASLETYRQYMINHESGHRFGNGHELCPAAGAPAPVMEQQTLGLHGCTPNPWPYLNGERYRGRPGQYNDSIPGA